MKQAIKYILLCLIICTTLTSCGIVPITGRRTFKLVSDNELLSASQSQYSSFVQKARANGQITSNHRVSQVSKRLIAATNQFLRQKGFNGILQNLRWEVNVVSSKQVNAFCMPGGKIVVYTGLLRLIGNGKHANDELAAVLGHEIGHALASHAAERMSNQLLLKLGGRLLFAGIGVKSAAVKNILGTAYGLGGKVFVALPFGRKQELEADNMGLSLMALAGYNPESAVNLWTKMAGKSGGKKNDFLSTHPSESKRIDAIKEELPKVMPIYRQYKR